LKEKWDFTRFKKEFFQYTGLDLDCYKDKQMERRISQLLVREGFDDLSVFFGTIKTDKEQLHKFYTYLTINTSVFYRDGKIYDYLQKTALIDLLKKFDRLNIWSMGCSHGEEPYTLALILDELSALSRASIMASDIDDKVLDMAREARYTINQLEKVPPNILKSAFIISYLNTSVSLIFKNIIYWIRFIRISLPCIWLYAAMFLSILKQKYRSQLSSRFPNVSSPEAILSSGVQSLSTNRSDSNWKGKYLLFI